MAGVRCRGYDPILRSPAARGGLCQVEPADLQIADRSREKIGEIVVDAALKMTGPPAGILVDD